MAQLKPPFLLTPYHCSNWFPFAAKMTGQELEVGVKPTPRKGILVTTLVIALVFGGFLWLIAKEAPRYFGGVLVLAILTTLGTPLLINLRFKTERGLGPVLTYHGSDEFISLPRRQKRLGLNEIDALAVVTAHDSSSEWCTQLQIHTKSGDRLLLATAYTKDEVMPLLEAIQRQINIPACFLKQASRQELQEEIKN